MQLLFKRSQNKNLLGRTVFNLWAKAACDMDEQDAARKYQLNSAVMIYVDQPGLRRDSFILGLIVAIMTMTTLATFLWREIGLGWFGVGGIGVIVGTFVALLSYHKLRETVMVSDLMYGRTFKCRSVVEMAQKEEWLRRLTGSFKQTLEASKSWGGEQVSDIPEIDGEDAIKLFQVRF